MDEVIEVVEVGKSLPLKHQLGKLLIATLAAFAATKLAEKSYDATLTAIQNHKLEVPNVEG